MYEPEGTRYDSAGQEIPGNYIDQVVAAVLSQSGSIIHLTRPVPFRNKLSELVSGALTKLHERGISLIYTLYGERIDPSLQKLIDAVESVLPVSRMRVGLIFDTENKEIFGGIRLFDGTKDINGEPAEMPHELLMGRRGVEVNLAKEMRSKGLKIFELGKFFLKSQGRSRVISRRLLYGTILRLLRTKMKDSVIFAHVATEDHREHYRLAYGFEVKETIVFSTHTEYIMTVESTKLLELLGG
jgi:hypothetical protein